MWNAELPWKFARCTTLTLTFRIPHSEFRILGGAGVGMVRIIAGEFKGRRLKTPAGDAVRPTGDRVREAWFSILQRPLRGARVLDLFAGSGALGLEADRKSTRLNSSHGYISYAVFCLKKKK